MGQASQNSAPLTFRMFDNKKMCMKALQSQYICTVEWKFPKRTDNLVQQTSLRTCCPLQTPSACPLYCPTSTWPCETHQKIHKCPSLESFIVKEKRTKHLYILWDFSYFPLVLLGSAPFLFPPWEPHQIWCPQAQGLLLSIVVLI